MTLTAQPTPDLTPLCAETRRWLSGARVDTPHHLTPPCPETRPLLSELDEVNRRGVLTVGSQPGLSKGGWWQRAFLDAICPAGVAAQLAEDLAGAGLLADHWPLHTPPAGRGPLTVTHGPSRNDQRTISLLPAGVLASPRQGSSPEVVLAQRDAAQQWQQALLHSWPGHERTLRHCHALIVVDPQWGRSAHLWQALRRALSRL